MRCRYSHRCDIQMYLLAVGCVYFLSWRFICHVGKLYLKFILEALFVFISVVYFRSCSIPCNNACVQKYCLHILGSLIFFRIKTKVLSILIKLSTNHSFTLDSMEGRVSWYRSRKQKRQYLDVLWDESKPKLLGNLVRKLKQICVPSLVPDTKSKYS